MVLLASCLASIALHDSIELLLYVRVAGRAHYLNLRHQARVFFNFSTAQHGVSILEGCGGDGRELVFGCEERRDSQCKPSCQPDADITEECRRAYCLNDVRT